MRMRWRRLAYRVLLSLLAMLALGFAWLWTADLGVFRPQIERLVANATGRQLSIDGELSIDLGGTTKILASDVRFGNPEWVEDADMVSVGSAEIHVDLWSLFDGPVYLSFVDVDDVDVTLVVDADGRANWELEAAPGAEPEADAEEPEGPPLTLGRVFLDEVRVTYATAERDEPLDVHLVSLRKDTLEDGYLELALDGTVNDGPVAIDGLVGPQAALFEGRDIEFELNAQVDAFAFTANGMIDDLAQPQQPQLRFTASGPDVNGIVRMLGLDDIGEGDIRLAGSLTPMADGPLALSVQGNVGRIEIESSGELSDLRDLERFDVDLLAAGPDVSRFLRLAGIDAVGETPFMLRLDATRDGPMLRIEEGDALLGETGFSLSAHLPNFPSFDDGRVILNGEGPDVAQLRELLDIPGIAEGPFSARLEYGVLETSKDELAARIETETGTLTAEGNLTGAPDHAGSRIRFNADLTSLNAIGSSFGLDSLPDAEATVTGAIELVTGGLQTTAPVSVRTEGLSVEASGGILFADGLAGTELDLTATATNLSTVSAWFDVTDGVPPLPVDIASGVEIDGRGIYIRDLVGTMGRSEIAIDGTLVPADGFSGTGFEFAAEGPAFEELMSGVELAGVRPGSYSISGDFELESDALRLRDVRLLREHGNVEIDLELGLPTERRHADFDVSGRGGDIRSVFGELGSFRFSELPFTVETSARLREDMLYLDELRATVGEATLAGTGNLNLLGGPREAMLRVSAEIPSLATLGTVDGQPLVDESLAISAAVASSGDAVDVDDLEILIGDSDIRGGVRLRDGDVPEIDIRVMADSLILPPPTVPDDDEQASEDEPESVTEEGRVFPDIAIPFDTLATLDAHFELSLGYLERGALRISDLVIRADLRDGAIDVSELGFEARSGRLDARMQLDPAGGTGEFMLDLATRDFALGVSPDNEDLSMKSETGIRLRSVGADVRTLASNAEGTVYFRFSGGRIRTNRTVQMLHGDFADEFLRAINPLYGQDPYTEFDCIVAPLRIADGNLTSDGNVLARTDTMDMLIWPTVDLTTEELDVVIRSRPRRGLTVSVAELLNPYLKVIGTLRRPVLAVDEEGVLISGGAAAATGGLSVLATVAWRRLTRSGDPCAAAVERSFEALGDPFPSFSREDLPENETPSR